MTEPTSSNYPSALDSNTTLGGDAVNLTSLTLDTSMDASVTTVSVTEDISAINVPCYLLIGSELIYATAKGSGNFISCDRGAGSTSAASHTNGDTVYVVYAANLFNQLKRAIIAIETEIGAAPKTISDTSTTPAASPASVAEYLDMLAYQIKYATGNTNWYDTPGSSLVASRPGENVLYNGGFRIAQRGSGPFTSASTFVNNDDSYLLDGCIFLANGSDTCDVSRVADNDFVSGYKMRMDVETASRRFGALFPVESINIQRIRAAGKASLQFKVKCTGTSMSNVRAYLLAWNGTADTITSDVISAWNAAGADPTFVANWTAENTGSNTAINTSIQTVKIQNITVDTASVANLAVLIMVDDTDATIGDFLEIGDVKLEAGPLASPYENNPIQVDYINCLRYFEYIDLSTTSASYSPMGVASSTTAGLMQVPIFPKRNAAGNSLSVGTVGNLLFQAQTLNTFVGVPRLPNFMIATISTLGSWTSGAAGFLTTAGGGGTYITVSNEL